MELTQLSWCVLIRSNHNLRYLHGLRTLTVMRPGELYASNPDVWLSAGGSRISGKWNKPSCLGVVLIRSSHNLRYLHGLRTLTVMRPRELDASNPDVWLSAGGSRISGKWN